ncbi:MAG: glycosyltransferase family 2 protein [Paracoccus sp. (in: a-proteobacteria)]|uniref:glycosyltransferase family 2 protein n=1 Tax=Paracoccus sp. TaxID=267 RepID=UPI0026DFE837|nr:glycosyltransferase family 2 protein [Paracoccus sp. (in: a-proteobacteria)]MDO5611754.1 glycosyltransferase family 2 protein [Paracoccus sp. (in: a-proteobacteria)]
MAGGDQPWRHLDGLGLFDAGWYAARYPDVACSGLSPLDHYTRLGHLMGRDPGPGLRGALLAEDMAGRRAGLDLWLRDGPPDDLWRRVMVAARGIAASEGLDQAAQMARTHLGDKALRPLHLIAADLALRDKADGRQAWLGHLNAYLAPWGIAPLRLDPQRARLLDRLTTDPLPPCTGGPLVSVVMAAWNAADTIAAAARSILNQTWRNLELLIVDDASTDATAEALRQIAASDSRVRVIRNARNLGPFVSKNIAICQIARGDWITGHDADDWAHPQWIERHLSAVLRSEGAILASTAMMLRMGAAGHFGNVIPASLHHAPDGFRRRAFVSALFHADTLRDRLGYFDSVRFGADGEMIARAQSLLGPAWRNLDVFAMLCLDAADNLTNAPASTLHQSDGAKGPRQIYNESWRDWHSRAGTDDKRLDFPQNTRRFPAPPAMIVPASLIPVACRPDQPEPADA